MQIEARPATEGDKPILSNLLQLYLHDFSEFDGDQVLADGRFEYPYFPLYWEEAERHPFLILADGLPAGFALIRQVEAQPLTMSVAEFFVLRGQRRKGIGREGFRQILQLFLGHWEVRVMAGYMAALRFWERVIAEVAEDSVDRKETKDGKRDWIVFRFGVS